MRVAIADDSTLFRDGLELLLTKSGVEVVLAVGTADELMARLPDPRPDTVIVDIRMPPKFSDEGLAAAETLKGLHPDMGVLVLSTYAEPEYAFRLLRPGQSDGLGYLLKDRVSNVETLLAALRRVGDGEQVVDAEVVRRLLAARRREDELRVLTPREREVLGYMAEGRSNAGIAHMMGLAGKTVETHAASVFAKLNLQVAGDGNRRVLAVLAWLRVHPAPPRPKDGQSVFP